MQSNCNLWLSYVLWSVLSTFRSCRLYPQPPQHMYAHIVKRSQVTSQRGRMRQYPLPIIGDLYYR